jgi:peptide/nickel transport system permease protein
MPAQSDVILTSIKSSTFLNLIKYLFRKILTLFLMVSVSVLAVILIANFGGEIDEMVKAEIQFAVGQQIRYDVQGMDPAEREAYTQEILEERYALAGINEPFIKRTLRWFWMAISLDLGHPVSGSPFFPTPDTETTVKEMLAFHIPPTLVLFGTTNLVIFFLSVITGLGVSQRYHSRLDKIVQKSTLLSTLPPWFYGVILSTALVLANIHIRSLWILIFVIFIATFFQQAYSWRTFFLLFAEEDYVEFAIAQGLPNNLLMRKAIIRPALPTILTNFSLTMIGSWMGSVVLEAIFGWPGLGRLLYYSAAFHDTSVIIGVVVIYAYLLAITIFILDLAYFFVDPRIQVQNKNLAIQSRRKFRLFSPTMKPTPRLPKKGKLPSHNSSLWQAVKISLRSWWRDFVLKLERFRQLIRDLAQDKTIKCSMITVSLMIVIAIATMIAIPYQKAIDIWRGDDGNLIYAPRNAKPVWTNWFTDEKLPTSIIMKTAEGEGEKIIELTETSKVITTTFTFDYNYVESPEDINLYIDSEFESKQPLYFLYWEFPNGDRKRLANFVNAPDFRYCLTTSEEIQKTLRSEDVEASLFNTSKDDPTVNHGTYSLIVEAIFFEPDSEMDVELVMRGRVFGIFGTDMNRRNLTIVYLWGLPIVLAFGLFGALLTNFLSVLIAAVGSWYGGWLDALIQRITEINMAIPAFPIMLMVFSMYSKSILSILGVAITLNIFGPAIKSYYATFLQVKQELYIESALAYGARDGRIIFRYLIPRIISVLIPHVIVTVPTFIFLEAALAFLQMSDPVFPTWGKLFATNIFSIYGESISYSPENLVKNLSLQLIIPIVLLILLTISFHTLGRGLEKTLNPRLREK